MLFFIVRKWTALHSEFSKNFVKPKISQCNESFIQWMRGYSAGFGSDFRKMRLISYLTAVKVFILKYQQSNMSPIHVCIREQSNESLWRFREQPFWSAGFACFFRWNIDIFKFRFWTLTVIIATSHNLNHCDALCQCIRSDSLCVKWQ